MRTQLSVLVATALAHVAIAHDGHQHGEQMPLGYVKYPYQAMYPGDNEGRRHHIPYHDSQLNVHSHRRLHLLWHYHVCEVTVGAMSR